MQGALAKLVINHIKEFSRSVLNTYVTKHHDLKLHIYRVYYALRICGTEYLKLFSLMVHLLLKSNGETIKHS